MSGTFETTTVLAALFLWIIFNHFGYMLNCDLQRVIEQKPLVRNMLALVAFYFLFTVIDPNNNQHVLYVFGKTALVFILFVLATKARVVYVSIALLLLFADQVIKNHVAYLEKNQKDEGSIEQYKKARRFLLYAIVAVILLGTLDYSIKQMREHGVRFRWGTFFLGTNQCSRAYSITA